MLPPRSCNFFSSPANGLDYCRVCWCCVNVGRRRSCRRVHRGHGRKDHFPSAPEHGNEKDSKVRRHKPEVEELGGDPNTPTGFQHLPAFIVVFFEPRIDGVPFRRCLESVVRREINDGRVDEVVEDGLLKPSDEPRTGEKSRVYNIENNVLETSNVQDAKRGELSNANEIYRSLRVSPPLRKRVATTCFRAHCNACHQHRAPLICFPIGGENGPGKSS
mmetsp:Transcript_9995/g.16921  ORF Transcript_9995/g.16921 Transcript_9995/m.16921 type:complete len:218 (-) Transcript_9995:103-756(-)